MIFCFIKDVTDHAAMVAKKEDEHDKAMFGPKWRDAENRYNEEKRETIADVEVNKEIPLANARVIFLLFFLNIYQYILLAKMFSQNLSPIISVFGCFFHLT